MADSQSRLEKQEVKLVAIDTNELLDNPMIVYTDDFKPVILSSVLRELEGFKKQSGDRSYKARKATRLIEKHMDDIVFDIEDYKVTFSNDFDEDYEDNKIIQACVTNGYSLLTNDILLKLKAYGAGIDVIDNDKKEDSHYKGYKKVCLDENELAHLYENMEENIYDLIVNQYLWVKNKDDEDIDVLRWNGEKLVELSYPQRGLNKFKPINILQKCAMDILANKDIPIKIIAGTYGSGKTLLSVKMSLWHLKEKGNYSKMVVVRQPHGSGKEIGFLSGDFEDKTKDFYTPIIQHLDGGEQEAKVMEINGVLEKKIPFYMKGLSIRDSIILVDEAEDLTRKEIKLLGTRPEEDSCVIFSGDYNQAEDDYVHDSGLMSAIDVLKGNSEVGIIVLDKDERSEASKLFSEL